MITTGVRDIPVDCSTKEQNMAYRTLSWKCISLLLKSKAVDIVGSLFLCFDKYDCKWFYSNSFTYSQLVQFFYSFLYKIY